LQLELQNQNLR